jgi:hypothetical protein
MLHLSTICKTKLFYLNIKPMSLVGSYLQENTQHLSHKHQCYLCRQSLFVVFEVLTSVTMNVATLWDIAPCSICKLTFRRNVPLHLQGRKSAAQETSVQQVDRYSHLRCAKCCII